MHQNYVHHILGITVYYPLSTLRQASPPLANLTLPSALRLCSNVHYVEHPIHDILHKHFLVNVFKRRLKQTQ